MKKYIIIFFITIVVVILAVGGYFGARYYLSTQVRPEYLYVHPTIAKIFGLTPSGIFYKNSGYGFTMIFPKTWKGFTIQEKKWQGWDINDGNNNGHVRDINSDSYKYSGPEILVKNPQTTVGQQYQGIPIMIFTHDIWSMVGNEQNATVAISAAPIGPEKIGENAKYVFATPPRWYGFTDAVGFEEAVNIVKTFKAF